MGDRIPRGEPVESNPQDSPEGRLVDFPEIQVEPLRTVRRRSPVNAVVSPGDRGQDRDYDETEFQRVGGRRRFRSEVLLVIVGSLFLAVTLLKPWSLGPAAPKSSAAPIGVPTSVSTAVQTPGPADLAAQVETPTPRALRSPVGWPDVPQWDYGWPVPGASQSAQQGGAGAAADPRWSAVDWTVLSTIDPHDGWGYGAAMMLDVAQLPSGATTPTPFTSWFAAGPPRYTTITLGPGLQVFGLAVTWPHDIQVTSVTVGYIGGPDHPANMPPAGFPAYAQVSPLPAAQVASSSPAAAGGGAAATARQAVGASATIWSGQFWIPPSADPSSPASTSVPNAWRSQPWPWPDGIYSIAITSTTGTTSYLLTLQTG
jgi:hypothetical protein